MSPEVKKRYEEEKKAFIDEKHTKQHYEYKFKVDVPFTQERTMVYEE